MDQVGHTQLADLCFLDDRDDEFEAVRAELSRYGQSGVNGPFAAIFGRDRRYTSEVASVYAEQFHRLGYLQVSRLIDDPEWQELVAGLRDWVGTRDVRRNQVEEKLGAPSLVVAGRVLCYAPADMSGWAFVDCWDEAPRRYVPGRGRFEPIVDDDELVRDIRIPAETFEAGLILTLYGRVLRWGPGWWIHHPSDDQSEQSRAIAAQLRQIEDADPSQGPYRLDLGER